MNLLQLALQRNTTAPDPTYRNLSLNEYMQYFSFNGNKYPFGGTQSWGSNDEERVDPLFASYAADTMKRNGIVWAVNLKRQQLFSEARYGFRRLRDGRPAEMFGSQALTILEEPQPHVRTVTMNGRLIQDVDLAGNAYLIRRTMGQGMSRTTQLRRPRPDWCKILLGTTEEFADGTDPTQLDLEPLGLIYYPNGNFDDTNAAQRFHWDDVMHWAPYPDPHNSYIGMSWITPIIREVQADSAATTHKHKYWENAATPNLMVKLDIDDHIKFMEWVDAFNKDHKGVDNAYKTLFLGAGADPTVIGSNMQQMDFANVAGVSENRIVIAGGLTATLLGTTEGLKGSSLNAGNYTASRRSTADTTLANLFRTACSALQKVVDTPPDAELWYWAEDIPFLQEDQADRADIQQKQAAAIRQLVDGGYEPDTVIAAIDAGDLSLLVHSGKVSVQLQEPGSSIGISDE